MNVSAANKAWGNFVTDARAEDDAVTCQNKTGEAATFIFLVDHLSRSFVSVLMGPAKTLSMPRWATENRRPAGQGVYGDRIEPELPAFWRKLIG
jgi:hypothetical protein